MAKIDIPLPTLIPYSQEFGLKSNTRTFRSQFTGHIQTQEVPGSLWMCQYTFPLLTDAQMRIYKAFLAKLRGQANRFSGRDLAFIGPSVGGILGTASQGGNTMTLSEARTFNAGDYVGVTNHGELKMIVEDSVGTTITVEPPFRRDHVAEPLTLDTPACEMVLDVDSVKWSTVSPVLSSLQFSGTEALS